MSLLLFFLILAVVVVVALVLVHQHNKAMLQIQASVDAQLLERQKAIEKQGRALIREHERTRRMAEKTVQTTGALHKDVQRVLCDPKIQKVLTNG